MRRPLLPFLTVLFGLLLSAQEPPPWPGTRQFSVPLHDGRLPIDELVQALCREYELDGSALHVPAVHVDLRGAPGHLLLLASRKVLLDSVRFRRDLAQNELLVTVDRERARDVRRQLRTRLAEFAGRLTGEDLTERKFELALPPSLDATRPLCVLVHGVDSDPAIWSDLCTFLTAAPRRVQVATFAYPNDESVDRVATQLSRKLRELGPQPVVLVGHSMGGLVARAVVEDPALDPGNVRTLILTGVPNIGSNLAGFRFALEAADALRSARTVQPFTRELLAVAVDHWRDGLGEAGGDLLPGSLCIERLTRRHRNQSIEYHLVLGTHSVLTAEQLAAVQQAVKATLADRGLARVVRPRLERWIDELDELADSKGDGAVSVARGQLAGVEPWLVPLDHVGLVRLRGLLRRVEKAEDHPVFAKIASWVEASVKPLPR